MLKFIIVAHTLTYYGFFLHSHHHKSTLHTKSIHIRSIFGYVIVMDSMCKWNYTLYQQKKNYLEFMNIINKILKQIYVWQFSTDYKG